MMEFKLKLRKPQRMVYSKSTRRVRRYQTIAKSVIYLAAGLTMSILVFIVGFIILNGFIASPVDSSRSLPHARVVVPTEDFPEGISVVVNRKLRIDDLTYEELRDIYSGENNFWGYISQQNIKTLPLLAGNAFFSEAVSSYLLLDQEGEGIAAEIEKRTTDVLERVRSEKGAIAILPSSLTETLPRGVKTIGIRDLSLAVHPEIIELQNGRRLTFLRSREGLIEELVNGSIENWSEIGGPSREIVASDREKDLEGEYEPLAVRPLSFSGKVPFQAELFTEAFPGYTRPDSAVKIDSLEQFFISLRHIPGAFGIIRTRDVIDNDLKTLEIRRQRTVRNLRFSFLLEKPSRAGAVGGISSIIVNTLVMILFVLLIATPVGVGAAIYLVEYAKQGRLVSILRMGTETLAGIPSIIFGLFGLVFFSQFLGLKTGLVSGALTLMLMILPTIIRTSEEALKAVPVSLREGSMALGATRLQTIFRTVLPTALPGILTGVILGIGRAIGETAAILFTMGSNMSLIRSLNSPIRVLSVHLYLLIRENISVENAFATATILIIIVFIVNLTTRTLIRRFSQVNV